VSVCYSRVATGSKAETAVLGHVWKDRLPANRAYVRVAKPDGEYVSEVACGPTGTFYIPVLPGDWKIICFAPRNQLQQELAVTRGDQYDIEFVLDAA
jgi:hypothetical protein